MEKNLLAFVLVASALGDIAVCAQSITYNPGDLLAAFREGGKPDLVVDLGSISNFQSPSQNSTFNMGADLTSTFGSLSSTSTSIYWSVFTYDGSGIHAPANTLWMSDPRSNINVQNSAPTTGTSKQQGNVAGQLGAIVDALSASFGTVIDNQVTQLPNGLGASNGGDPASYTSALGPSLDFNGTFGQNFENLLTNSLPSVSDLFQQNPASDIHHLGTGAYLGSFTLAPNGILSFNAVPEPSTWAMLGSGFVGLMAFRRLAKQN